jgi:hypothetical protein
LLYHGDGRGDVLLGRRVLKHFCAARAADDRRWALEPQAKIGGQHRVGLDPVGYLGRIARPLPRIEVEVRDCAADVLEELVRDGARGGLVLVAEEEVGSARSTG